MNEFLTFGQNGPLGGSQCSGCDCRESRSKGGDPVTYGDCTGECLGGFSR